MSPCAARLYEMTGSIPTTNAADGDRRHERRAPKTHAYKDREQDQRAEQRRRGGPHVLGRGDSQPQDGRGQQAADWDADGQTDNRDDRNGVQGLRQRWEGHEDLGRHDREGARR